MVAMSIVSLWCMLCLCFSCVYINTPSKHGLDKCYNHEICNNNQCVDPYINSHGGDARQVVDYEQTRSGQLG